MLSPVVVVPCSLHLAGWLDTLACCKPKWPQGCCTAAAGLWGRCEHCKQGMRLLPFNGGAPLLLSNPIGMKYMGPGVMISSDAYCCWQPCFHIGLYYLGFLSCQLAFIRMSAFSAAECGSLHPATQQQWQLMAAMLFHAITCCCRALLTAPCRMAGHPCMLQAIMAARKLHGCCWTMAPV